MLVDADAFEDAAEQRAQQEGEEEIHGDELHECHVVEIDRPLPPRIGQLEAEEGKNGASQIGAVRAAAELRVVEDEEDHLPEGERDHEKEEAARPERECADEERSGAGCQHGERQRHKYREAGILGRHEVDRVGGEPVESAMAEADEACATDEELKAQR